MRIAASSSEGARTPTIDVFDHYFGIGELQVVKSGAQALTLTAFQNFIFTPPVGKCWRVLAAGGHVGLNAADTALVSMGSIGVLGPGQTVNGADVFAFAHNAMATGVRTWGTTFRPPLFVPNGFSVNVSFATSAAVTVAANWFSSLVIQEMDQ